MNDDSVEADAEMIALVVESLLQTGLREFQLSIGEVEYFKGLCEEAGLSTETAEDLRELISGKNLFGAEELLKERNVCIEERERLLKVSDFFGAVEILDEAENQVHNETSKQAVLHLKKLYEVLKAYGVEKYISFDLGMLSKYQYMLQMPASMAGGDSKPEQMVSMMMFSQAVETEKQSNHKKQTRKEQEEKLHKLVTSGKAKIVIDGEPTSDEFDIDGIKLKDYDIKFKNGKVYLISY